MGMEPLDAQYMMGYREGVCGIKKQPHNRSGLYARGRKAGCNVRHKVFREAEAMGLDVEIRLVPPDEAEQVPDDMDSRMDVDGAVALLRSLGEVPPHTRG